MQLQQRWLLSMLIVSVILIMILSACQNQDDSGSFIPLPGNDSGVQFSRDEAIQAAETFLNHWNEQDYNTMYGRISPNARDAYIQEEFTRIYTEIWDLLKLRSIQWKRGNVVTQGTTVIYEYSVTFESAILGEFTDEGRVMRIIPTDEGMRIAWSRMDIFDGWSGSSRPVLDRFLPGRGNIYDRNGQPLADQNGVALSLYVVQERMSGVASCIDVLSILLNREVSDLEEQFSRYNPDTIFLVGEIDRELYQVHGADLQAACHPTIEERPTRRYFASVAPHVVGYVGFIPREEQADYETRGYPTDALVGVSGIEKAWERELAGTIGIEFTIRSAAEETVNTITSKAAAPGQSVYLTIDRNLQQGIQEAFVDAYNFASPTWGRTSRGAAAVVIDVKTGAILAMVSYPSFDPAVFNPDSPYLDPGVIVNEYQNDPARPMLNRAAQAAYPLGSVFKLVSSVTGADSGVYPLDNLNNCTGLWDGTPYGDRERTDWLPTGHGLLDGRGAIVNSCNPYYWQLGVALNTADPFLLPQYSHLFGFGEDSGLKGIPQNIGVVPDPDLKAEQGFTWSVSDTLNNVIGQGDTLVNPLQVARMVAVIANGGQLVTPYLVERVQLIGEEPSYQAKPVLTDLELDAQVLADVRQAMCDVTTTYTGTANFIYSHWYEFNGSTVIVCGKTGTAQSGGGNQEPHAWFAAFAPADQPEIAIAVIVENSCEGSEVASPIVARIVELYYGLPQYGWPALWQGACSQIVVE